MLPAPVHTPRLPACVHGLPEWEYITLDLSDVPRRTTVLDLLSDSGEQGWELVFITSNNIAYLKGSSRNVRRAPHARPLRARPRSNRQLLLSIAPNVI